MRKLKTKMMTCTRAGALFTLLVIGLAAAACGGRDDALTDDALIMEEYEQQLATLVETYEERADPLVDEYLSGQEPSWDEVRETIGGFLSFTSDYADDLEGIRAPPAVADAQGDYVEHLRRFVDAYGQALEIQSEDEADQAFEELEGEISEAGFRSLAACHGFQANLRDNGIAVDIECLSLAGG